MLRCALARLYHRAALRAAQHRLARLMAIPLPNWPRGHIRRIDATATRIFHHRTALDALQKPGAA